MKRWGLAGELTTYVVRVVADVKQDGDFREIPQSVLLPHELLGALYRVGGPGTFVNMMLPKGKASLATYWNRNQDQPWFGAHPYRHLLQTSASFCVPIRLHGDDAPLRHRTSILVLQTGA